MENLLPIPLPVATTLLWRTPPATQGKGNILWMRPPRVETPVLWRPSTASHYLGLTDVTVLSALLKFLGQSISQETLPRAIQPPWIPQSHEGRALACDLGKVQPRTVDWPNFTPSVASLALKLVLRSGQLRIKKLELPVHLLSPPKSEEQTIRATKC